MSGAHGPQHLYRQLRAQLAGAACSQAGHKRALAPTPDLASCDSQAEAAYWRKSEGYRVGWSDELLGFDCGGQQWVLETCFPTGPLRRAPVRCRVPALAVRHAAEGSASWLGGAVTARMLTKHDVHARPVVVPKPVCSWIALHTSRTSSAQPGERPPVSSSSCTTTG